MSKVNTASIIILTILIACGTAAGQKRARPKSKPAPPPRSTAVSSPVKRPVIINLIQGDQVKGIFLGADMETVQVEIQSGRLTIKLSDVASLDFSTDKIEAKPADEEPAASTVITDPTLPNARKAYSALRKLAEAAQIKLPYPQYGALLIEVKLAVEEEAANLPESPLKSDILRALEAYNDAGRAWGAAQTKDTIPISTEPGATLMKKYNIKPGLNRLAREDHLPLDTTLDTIWKVAGFYLNTI